MDRINNLTFDIMTTNKCNLACKYCIENEYETYHKQIINETSRYSIEDLIKFGNYLLDFYADTLTFNFWGGEPTLKFDIIDNLVSYYFKSKYMNEKRVRFYISTNGYKIRNLLELIDKYKYVTVFNNNHFFALQISYDGRPINNFKRVDYAGKDVTEQVVENIIACKADNLPVSIKSTITLDTLKYMHAAYRDIVHELKFDSYFPTIDYRSDILNNIKDDDMRAYKNDIKTNMFAIVKDELKYVKTNKKIITNNYSSRFSWLNINRSECIAGRTLYAIDTDGGIYNCHGCLTIKSKRKHKIGSIFNINSNLDYPSNIVNQLKTNIEQYDSAKKNIDFETCNNCDATYCLKCNSAKFAASNKDEYYDKWFDYSDQPKLCELYCYISNIARAYRQLLQKINQKDYSL